MSTNKNPSDFLVDKGLRASRRSLRGNVCLVVPSCAYLSRRKELLPRKMKQTPTGAMMNNNELCMTKLNSNLTLASLFLPTKLIFSMDHKKYLKQIASLGGKARALKLTSERRREIALKAGQTRIKNRIAKEMLAEQVANGTYSPRYANNIQSLQ